MATDGPLAYHVALDLSANDLARAIGRMRSPALLQGGGDFGGSGRWSFFTAQPVFRFWCDDKAFYHRRAALSEDQPDYRIDHRGNPFRVLDAYLAKLGLDPHSQPLPEDCPPFQGGLIGFYSYDLAPFLERLPRRSERETSLPEFGFHVYDTVAWIDHKLGTCYLSAYDLFGEDSLTDLKSRAENWLKQIHEPAPAIQKSRLTGPLVSNFSRKGYLDAVERALEYIRAGDIFQVNLSQRFEGRGSIDGLDLYLRLREHSTAPYSAYLGWDDSSIVSASPELFFETQGPRIVTRPIKGTRPRGRTLEEDHQQRAELESSEKDRAELTMIVDLERNDLGRVCQYGSMRVAEPRQVESFAQVHHLVATVEGRLRPGCTAGDVVKAVFPGGSITGAPKIRAMEIIDELEPTRRGLYTGAIGYYSRGASAFNIAIRTVLVEGNRVSYQVGGGIVADSIAEAEYEETLHKGRGLREVIEGKDA